MAKKPEPPALKTWTIYKVAAKVVWLGTVEAPNRRIAIEKGAEEFEVDAWRLYAVERR
jgi:hypothetical protein